MKTLFVEAHSSVDVLGAVKKAVSKIIFKKLGLVTTVQFVDSLEQVKGFLETKNKQVLIGTSNKHAVYPGQILGCDVEAAKSISEKVDGFLYIGSGEFHPIAVANETKKPVLRLDPFSATVTEIDEKDAILYEKKKIMRVSKVTSAKVIGIIVSTKLGQCNLEVAEELKEKLIKAGKDAYIFVSDMVDPNQLMNFPQIEAWVNTACPRMIDDYSKFNRPIANADEVSEYL